MATGSPTVALWQLARELTRLREGRGLRRTDAARLIEVSNAAVGRWEAAERVPREKDLKHLLRSYELTEGEIADLVELRRQAGKRGWWQPFDLDQRYGTFIGLEAAASGIETFENSLITGLLQTEDYARETIRGTAPRGGGPDLHLDQQMEARLARQQRAFVHDGPDIWVVMGEAALRQRIGGAKVLREQLKHLLEAMEWPKLNIAVIPFGAGAHVGLCMQTFMILRLKSVGLTTVYIEGERSNLFLENEEDIAQHESIFNLLRLAGVGGDLLRNLLLEIISEL
ncbi:helix-turn-helix protein [Murinocardiopsis flavida]|uniref:Helix-turn-helix protein n=1 Tax=Murinocardiopsis flavida TaxID=645275 RepID=A0A2P8DJV9_9ACTN|nr:DUF5753 domain-containing protein [Murinocardiopsis flavida]PSK97471.1 helix-turn-helix protein [Murinocardiopsis flavida]